MLILQRKVGETLLIGDDIEVTVVAVDAGRVRLAIEAPRSLSILRSELRKAAKTNQESAQEETSPIELIDFLGGMIRRNGPQGGTKRENT